MRGSASLVAFLLGAVATVACSSQGGGDGPRADRAAARGPGRDAGSPDLDGAGAAQTPGGGPAGSAGIVAAATAAAADCADPVTGVWIAKTFADQAGRWHEHRITITRDASRGLTATQLTHMWDGGPDDAMPAACGRDRAWGEIEMTADVDWTEGVLHVWGTSVVRRAAWCGANADSYNLDSFTGRVRKSTYSALNNDDHDAINRPYRFRRIACIDP